MGAMQDLERQLADRARAGEPAALAALLSSPADAGAAEALARETAAARPLGELPTLVALLHAHAPALVLEPRVVACVQVALELEALAPERLAALLGPLLASEDRLRALLRSDGAAPLAARQHAAALVEAAASATSFTGTLDGVVAPEHQPLFWVHVRRLFLDRNAHVGARAAWAVGLLARVAPPAEELAQRARAAKPGIERRRGLVAFAARCVSGELDDADLVPELLERSGRDDPNAAAAVVHALARGLRAAPGTVRGVVEDLLAGGPPEVAAVAAAFAWALPAGDREALLERVRARAGAVEEGALDFWLAPRLPSTTALLSSLAALRAQAPSAVAATTEAAGALVADVAEASARCAAARGPVADETDRALELVLFDAPLARDLALASAPSAREAEARRAAWDGATEALVAWRLGRAKARGLTPALERERLAALATALDGAPREVAPGAPSPGFVDVAAEARRHALGVALGREVDRRERALAGVIAVSVEPFATGGPMGGDLVAALLREVEPAMLRALATSVGTSELRAVLAHRVELAAQAQRAVKSGDDEAAAAVAARIGELSAAVARLSPAGDPLGDGLVHLARAARVSVGREAAQAGLEGWVEAAVRLGEAQRAAAERLRISPPRTLSRKKAEAAFAGVLDPEARLALLHAEEAERARAIERAAGALPDGLRGAATAILGSLLRGDRKRAKRAAARASRAEVVPPGTRIGDYVVVRALGSGAMGHCLLVRRRREARGQASDLVLKLPREGSDLALFRREAAALLTLAQAPHPAVVRFVSFVDAGYRVPFLVMAHAEGRPLDAALGARGRFSRPEVLRIGATLAAGLTVAHELQIGHYDLKPANVVLDERSLTPVLVDWGLAGATLAGTPSYMSPERWDTVLHRGVEPPHPPSDVFALGCLLHELAAGRALLDPGLAPPEADRYRDVLARLEATPAEHRAVHLVSVLARDPYLTYARVEAVFGRDPLGAVIKACVQQAPAARPSARDLAATLAHYAAG